MTGKLIEKYVVSLSESYIAHEVLECIVPCSNDEEIYSTKKWGDRQVKNPKTRHEEAGGAWKTEDID